MSVPVSDQKSSSDPPMVGSIVQPSVSIKFWGLEATGNGSLGIGAIVFLTIVFVSLGYLMRREIMRLLKSRDFL